MLYFVRRKVVRRTSFLINEYNLRKKGKTKDLTKNPITIDTNIYSLVCIYYILLPLHLVKCKTRCTKSLLFTDEQTNISSKVKFGK